MWQLFTKVEIIAEEPIDELIQHSGTAYILEFENHLDPARTSQIKALGRVVQAKTIYPRKPEMLYQIFAVLKPLTLVWVKKGQANLSKSLSH